MRNQTNLLHFIINILSLIKSISIPQKACQCLIRGCYGNDTVFLPSQQIQNNIEGRVFFFLSKLNIASLQSHTSDKTLDIPLMPKTPKHFFFQEEKQYISLSDWQH